MTGLPFMFFQDVAVKRSLVLRVRGCFVGVWLWQAGWEIELMCCVCGMWDCVRVWNELSAFGTCLVFCVVYSSSNTALCDGVGTTANLHHVICRTVASGP